MNITSLSNKLSYAECIDLCQYAVMALLGTVKVKIMTSAEYKFFYNEVALRSQLRTEACKSFSDT